MHWGEMEAQRCNFSQCVGKPPSSSAMLLSMYHGLISHKHDDSFFVGYLRRAERVMDRIGDEELPPLPPASTPLYHDALRSSDSALPAVVYPTPQFYQDYRDRGLRATDILRSNVTSLLGLGEWRVSMTEGGGLGGPNPTAFYILEGGLRRSPLSLPLLLALGEVHAQGGDVVKSLKSYKRVFRKVDFSHPLPFLYAGRVYAGLGQHEHAQQHFDYCLALDPGFYLGYLERGRLSKERGERERAQEDLQRAWREVRDPSGRREVLTAHYLVLLERELADRGVYARSEDE